MDFERLINPKVCAIIGASKNSGKGSYRFLEGWTHNKFKGKIYPVTVNPEYTEILGLRTYPDIREVPDEIDYVLIAIPAKQVVEEVQKCVEKDVKFIVIFTSGFREVGNKQMEDEILQVAKGKSRILGPNCIGVYSTESRIGYFLDQPIFEPGNVSFISQSGGMARKFIWMSYSRGFRIRAAVSIGNTIDVSISELLEYFAGDPKTMIIGAYIEAIKEANKFFPLLKKISPKKPIVIMKTGRTSKGKVAAQSHTGAIAGSHEVFSAMVKQAGGILVDSYVELTDTILGLQHLKDHLPLGKNVAIINTGGGIAVEITDMCESMGLKVADIANETKEKLQSFIPSINTIFDNPIDLGAYGFQPEVFGQVIKYISQDPNIHSILTVHEIERFPPLNDRLNIPDIGEIYTQVMQKYRNPSKPIISIIPRSWERVDNFISYKNFQNDLLEVGIPSYDSPTRAIITLKKLIQYNRFLRNQSKK